MCTMEDVLEHADRLECVTCGHEWPREAVPEAPPAARVVKDAHGTVLSDGDCVVLIKDLKLKVNAKRQITPMRFAPSTAPTRSYF